MKKLVLASLITLAASQAAGCIIEGGTDEDALMSARWELRNIATNQVTTCPVGYDTAALYNQPIDGAGNPAGSVIIDLFDCDAGSGLSAPLPPTLYLTWIEIATRTNTSQPYAKSLSAEVDLTFEDADFATQILNDGGYFQLAWTLEGMSSGQPLECAGAGAADVDVIATEIADPNNFNSDLYDCVDKYGVTAGYRAGTYSLTVEAVDTGNNRLGITSIPSATINRQNAVTMLGTVEIPITGR